MHLVHTICASLALSLLASSALARDPTGKYTNAPHAKWYKEQRNSSGQSCCDESDAHPYHGDYSANADGSVTVDGETIPKDKVLDGPNPTGSAVWWFLDSGGVKRTYCFAVGSGA